MAFTLKLKLTRFHTIRYNPPEVNYQDTSPIELVDLLKCDMWAYGLALWEIFQDGATFFKKSWQDETLFARSWPESFLSDADRTIECPDYADSNAISEVAPPEIEESTNTHFGRFDPRHLSKLATEFIDSLKFGGGFVDKAILRKFLGRALQVDPNDRPSRITLGPLMSMWK